MSISVISVFFLHKQRKKGSRNYPSPLKNQEPFKEFQDPLKENQEPLKKLKNPLKKSPKPFNKRFQEPFKENQESFKKIPQNLSIKGFKELFSRYYFVTNTILFVFRLPF